MDWINNIILGLIDTYSTNNVYELLDFLRIKIIKLEKTNIMLNHNEALYYRNYLGDEIIFIKNDLSPNYERFILSHELGHALIHTSLSSASFSNSFLNIGKLEKQANYFAIRLSNIKFNEEELECMTIEQIASCLELPYEPLKQLVNI